jgi:hypothetical protein
MTNSELDRKSHILDFLIFMSDKEIYFRDSDGKIIRSKPHLDEHMAKKEQEAYESARS